MCPTLQVQKGSDLEAVIFPCLLGGGGKISEYEQIYLITGPIMFEKEKVHTPGAFTESLLNEKVETREKMWPDKVINEKSFRRCDG